MIFTVGLMFFAILNFGVGAMGGLGDIHPIFNFVVGAICLGCAIHSATTGVDNGRI